MRAVWLLALAACADTASPELGLGDLLYVDGAQYRPGAFPAATGGPDVVSLIPVNPTIVIGSHDEVVRGLLAPGAQSAILGIRGARGTWIVPAGAPNFSAPDEPTLAVTAGFSDALAVGSFELDAAAVDADGRIGAMMSAEVIAAPELPPQGDVVVTLAWIGTADLDLHVIDGAGHEAWQGHPNTQQIMPGAGPCDWASGGILDHDANMDCARSGQTTEDVVWTTRTCLGTVVAPVIPPGMYTVRVEARDMCSDASAPWAVSVYQAGVLAASARGIATPYEATYDKHGAGAGTTALTFSE
jgi:hypothetical protein